MDEIEAERRFRAELVKKEDFSELKAIIKELVEVQKRTEISIERLTQAHTRFERTFESKIRGIGY